MKPVSELKDDEFLKLVQAEQDVLLTIKIETSNINEQQKASTNIKKATSNDDWDEDDNSASQSNAQKNAATSSLSSSFSRSIIDKLKSFYHKDEFSYNVEQWNIQRGLIIDEMCNKFLFPDLNASQKS